MNVDLDIIYSELEKLEIEIALYLFYLEYWTYKAKQDSLTILAEFFDVDETWLMGFDVPMKSERKKLSKKTKFLYWLVIWNGVLLN